MEILKEEKYHITSLKQYFEIIEARYSATTEQPLKWIFRGQDNFKYDLMPSIGRLLNTGRFKTVEELLIAEQQAFYQFEIDTYVQLKEPNLFIVLAVAQHHGLKTRLLDWTFSPLVALFFAVENENMHNVDGAIFAFIRGAFTTILRKNEHPLKISGSDYQYLAIPPLSPRITAQSGVFQLFRNPTKPLENHQNLEKLIIPAECKKDLKIDLYNAGITYHSLFPDINGVAKNINYMHFNL